jgi:archaellum component FlaF (FlaF/FlaG flagellin family)
MVPRNALYTCTTAQILMNGTIVDVFKISDSSLISVFRSLKEFLLQGKSISFTVEGKNLIFEVKQTQLDFKVN